MRGLAAAIVLVSLLSAPISAQERNDAEPKERLQLSALRPLDLPILGPLAPTKVGPLTFVDPQLRGEIVRVGLPVGEYVSRGISGIASANRRRQEAAARRKVQAELEALTVQKRPD